MSLIRNNRKLVRPGQWVLAKINPTCWIKTHSYDFQHHDVAWLCITTEYGPVYNCRSAFEYHYRVNWRFPRAEPVAEGEREYFSHHREYRVKAEGDAAEIWKDGGYVQAATYDFGLLEYNGSGQPGPWDEEESKKRRHGTGGYLYEPASENEDECPGPDYSLYFCDQCNKFVIPWSNDDGDLVCSGCSPLSGLIHDAETAEQIDRARALADYVGPDARRSLERGIEHLAYAPNGLGLPRRAYLHKEDKFSFYFVISVFSDGKWHRDYNGGLIMHGPHVEINPDGDCPADGYCPKYRFTTWDYNWKCNRSATQEEIDNIRWSTHT